MIVDDIVIEVRSLALGRLGQIDLTYVKSAQFIKRFNNVGSWQIILPAEYSMAQELSAEGRGIIVWGPTGQIISGRMLNYTDDQSATDPQGTRTFNGVDDNIHLADALAFPLPSEPDVSLQTDAYDVRDGLAETVLLQNDSVNIGPAAPAGRRNNSLTLETDLGRGGLVTGRARFDQLGLLLSEVASVGGLGFDVKQDSNSLVFSVYEPEDKSSLIRMDIDNDLLESVSSGIGAPTGTRVVVAGQGQAEERTFIQITDAEATAAEAAWGRKIEIFKDRRDTDDVAELTQTGTDIVTTNGRTVKSLTVRPADDVTMVFGRDWFLGDIVTVVVRDQELQSIVTAAIIQLGQDGVKVGAVIGDPTGFDYDSQLAAKQQQQENRLAFLEKNTDYLTRDQTVSIVEGLVHYGAVAGVSSTGVTVTLEDSLGTVTALTRGRKYFPIVGDRVLMTRSGSSWVIVGLAKIAGAVRADITPTANWTRYLTEAQNWQGADSGGWGPLRAYRTTNGVVKLGGLVRKWQGGAFVSGEKIATIPVGFRPDHNCVFTHRHGSGTGRLAIDSSDGSIYALDGDAAFVSLDNVSYLVGGTWTAATLLNSWAATASIAVPGGGPTLTLPVPGYAQDSNHVTWTRGGCLRATDPTTDTAIFTYPANYGPLGSYRNHMRSAGHTATNIGYSTVGVAASGTNRDRRWQTGSSRGIYFDGTPFVSESSTLTPYGATTAIPAPIIPDTATSYSAGTFWTPRMYMTPEGFCILHGLVALASITTIGWIPPEARPRYRALVEVVTTTASGRIDVFTNGKVSAVAGTAGWGGTDSVSWMADAGEVDQADGGA